MPLVTLVIDVARRLVVVPLSGAEGTTMLKCLEEIPCTAVLC